jgi:hypothetical protein
MKFFLVVFISSITFGVIDTLFELYLEEEYQENIIHHTNNEILATVMTSAISSAISILVYSQIDKYLIHTHKKIPIYDSIGVIIGAFIVYFIYKYVL